jgi:YVTN family beta-propeller protein
LAIFGKIAQGRNTMRALGTTFCVGLLLGFAGQSASAQTVRVYATNSGGDNVNIIDPATNKTVSTLEGIEGAHGVAFSPDGSRVYVSNEADATLDVFDQKTNRLIKKVVLSGRPNNIAVAKDGRIVVAIAQDPGALDIIDPVKLERKVSILHKGRLHNTYVTPDSKYAISGSTRTNMFTVVDLAKEEVAWELNLGKGVRPMTIDTNPDGSTKRVFVQVSELNGFRVVDFAQRKDVGTFELPKDGGVEVIHHRLDSPSHGIGVQPDNKVLWVTSILLNAAVAYSLTDLKPIGTVKLPELRVSGRAPMASVPNWVTFTPDSKQMYVSNAAMNAVTAIDTQAMKELAVIPVGQAPKRIGTLVTN